MTDVISSSSLYFFNDPDQVMREVVRALGSRGRMTLCYNDSKWLRNRSFAQENFRIFECEEVEALLSGHRFSQVTTRHARDLAQGLIHCTTGILDGLVENQAR